jgi:hypothetical protein
LPDVPEGATLRNFLAEAVCCHPKRISKKYEGKSYHGRSYNGRQLYWRNTQSISDDEAMKRLDEVDELRVQFKKSREALCDKKAKTPVSRNNSINSKKHETCGSSGKRPSIICRSESAPITDRSQEKVPAASHDTSIHSSFSTKAQTSRPAGLDRKPSPKPDTQKLPGFHAAPPKTMACPKSVRPMLKSQPPGAKDAPVPVTAAYLGTSSKEAPSECAALVLGTVLPAR